MAITNLIALGTTQTSDYEEFSVTVGDPKTLIQIGTAYDAEYELSVVGSDAATYVLASYDREAMLYNGVVSVPGQYRIRRVKKRGTSAMTSGLDIMDGSA